MISTLSPRSSSATTAELSEGATRSCTARQAIALNVSSQSSPSQA